jgi:hypothetical protein
MYPFLHEFVHSSVEEKKFSMMDDLKDLIRNKSKSKPKPNHAPSSEPPVVEIGPNQSGPLSLDEEHAHSLEPGTKKSRILHADCITSFRIEDLILGRTQVIPAKYALNREDRRVLDSYFDGMDLPRKIPGEDDMSCILRCKSAVDTKLSGSIQESETDRDVQPSDTGEINVLWYSLEKKLLKADGSRVLYNWFLSILQKWITEFGEGAANTELVQLSRSHFDEACSNIESLLEDIESCRLEPSIKAHLIAIAEYSVQGLFQEAETEYMRIALGKQTWILGVGNCFIQERSSLDRIREVKHIMNDERVRSYIQCVKRLISRAKQHGSN